MASASGIVGEIIRALEVAGSDALAVTLPEARVVDVTRSLARRWSCARSDLVGQRLSQAGDGVLATRYIDADLSDAGTRTAARVDLTYRPQGREPATLRFSPQLVREGTGEFLLLIGPSGSGRVPAGDAEAWRALATEGGKSAVWDYDLAARRGDAAPEIAAMLGLDPSAVTPSVLALDSRAHPGDAALTLNERLRELSDRIPAVRTRYRLRHEDGAWRWIDATAALVREPDSGQPLRIVGVLRDVTAEMAPEAAPAAQKEEAEPRPTFRSEAAERLTGEIARDFRLLIAGTHGNLRLAEEARDKDEVRARIRTVIEALERGLDLANRLIDFSQEPSLPPVPAPAASPLPPAPEEPAAVQQDFAAPDPAAPPAVLIVEDNDQVREVAIAMVEDLGYAVAGAASGPEALAILERRPDIRLLLSDVVMSGMMGPELVQQALAVRPRLKVLFASGYSGETIADIGTIPQVVDLISKPFTREELSEKVRRAMAEALAA